MKRHNNRFEKSTQKNIHTDRQRGILKRITKKKESDYLNVSAAVLSPMELSYEYHHHNALFHRDGGCRQPLALSCQ